MHMNRLSLERLSITLKVYIVSYGNIILDLRPFFAGKQLGSKTRARGTHQFVSLNVLWRRRSLPLQTWHFEARDMKVTGSY